MESAVEEDVSYDTATVELTDFNSDASNGSGTNRNESLTIIDANNESATSSVNSRTSMSSSIRSSSSSMKTPLWSSRIRLSHSESVQNINVEKLTMNKLRFASLKLHGREKEIEILRESFNRFVKSSVHAKSSASEGVTTTEGTASMQQNSARRGSKKMAELFPDLSSINSSEVVFISGESGSGKVSYLLPQPFG